LLLPLEGLGLAPLRRLTGGGGGFPVGDLTADGAETDEGRWPIDNRSLTEVDRATGVGEPETVAAEVVKPEVDVALTGV